MLTNIEIGAVILMTRTSRQLSQETLAELSGLTSRTIQRIEKGEGCSADSRRALARAFEIEDLDVYNKPFKIPSQEELAKQKAQFDKEHVTIATVPILKGKDLARFAETTQAHLFTCKEDLPESVELAMAEIEDLFVDYRDSHDCYSATDKLPIYSIFNEKVSFLQGLGVEICSSTRRLLLGNSKDKESPLKFTVLYVLASKKGDSPENISVGRDISFP